MTMLRRAISAPEHLARAAARALSWGGVVLPPMVLLGRRVVPVATLLEDVHERRVRSGWGPVTDRVSVATWDWPETRHHAPTPAVRLEGILAPARHWPVGLIGAAPFVGGCPAALLLPWCVAGSAECLRHAEAHGIAVVSAGGPHYLEAGAVEVVYPGRRRVGAAMLPAATSRWVHEVVYDRLLALSRIPPKPSPGSLSADWPQGVA